MHIILVSIFYESCIENLNWPNDHFSSQDVGGKKGDESALCECRVRYLSFLGIGRDVRHCGFIMHTPDDKFIAHVFYCEPSSGALCKTIEAACKVHPYLIIFSLFFFLKCLFLLEKKKWSSSLNCIYFPLLLELCRPFHHIYRYINALNKILFHILHAQNM